MQIRSNANLTHSDPVPVEGEHNASEDSDQTSHLLRQFHLKGECVVSYSGVSQYADGAGVSTCGIAALNCVRVIFSKERHGRQGVGLLKEIMSRDVMEEILSICAQWPSQFHLEVEDIYQTPIFETSLKLLSSKYSKPSYQSFERLLSDLQQISSSAAAVITRPPEIITCLKLVLSNRPLFIVFDSHPRPKHPNGAGLLFHASINAAALYLADLLAVDDRLLSDSRMQWQIQLLTNFCAHVFVSQDPSHDPNFTHAVLQSTLTILSLRNQLAELTLQNKTLTAENRRLETEAQKAETRHTQQIKRLRQELTAENRRSEAQAVVRHGKQLERFQQESTAVKSFHSSRPSAPDRTKARELDVFSQPSIASTSSSVTKCDPNFHRITTGAKGKAKNTLEFEWLDPEILLQNEADSSKPSLVMDGNQLENQYRPSFDTERLVPNHDSYPQAATTSNKGKKKSTITRKWIGPDTLLNVEVNQKDRLSANLAAQKQREFEAEDAILRKEREVLAKSEQRRFNCGICLDEHPEDFVARIDDCQHAFCRECIRTHIMSCTMEHRYPIFCPICIAGKGHHEPTTLDTMFIQQVGIPEEVFAIYEELQMAMFSVLIHCRKCRQSAFVDRDEHQRERLLVCPLPGCNYVWCKACQQEITIGGPQHSCDGSSELNYLMKEQGWKHCPGCQTPIQKDFGCNHMMDATPTFVTRAVKALFALHCGKRSGTQYQPITANACYSELVQPHLGRVLHISDSPA